MSNRIFLFLISFVWVLFSVDLVAQKGLPKDFDNWLENSRKDWEIPGMAVGIVKDGAVVYARGFGERKLGSGQAVDEHTVFSIASVSKNMTAAALAILVDEGKLHWDDPIQKHIPWFQLKDPWVSREVTLRDALIHRVGLGRILGNRLQFMTQSSRDEVLYQMRYMDFEKPFRSGFVYNNVMYSLAGQVIEYVEGKTWDEFLKQRLFMPLGMTRTTTTLKDMEKLDNIAYPHQEIDGVVVPIARRNWDNAGPAGGVNASVHDLTQWMLMQLGTSGTFKDQVIVSEKQMNEIHTPQIAHIPADAMAAQSSYGFGWNIMDYKHTRVWTHSGATDGFNTFMYLVPELDLGVVFVGNTFNSLGVAVAYQVIDAYLGVSDRDWNKEYLQRYQRQYEQAQKIREQIHQARNVNTILRLNPEEYVGIYNSKGYGNIEVFLQNNELQLRMWDDQSIEAVLEHWHYDTFRAVWKNRAMREEFLQFYYTPDGKVGGLDFEFVLRPLLLQVGAYPSNYTHTERFVKQSGNR